MQASITKAEGSFSTWKKFVGNNLKIKLPRSKFSGETELLGKMRDFSKLQGKLLQKTEFLHTARNLVRKFNVGTQLSGMVEYADKIKFRLNKVEDAKQFFDNMRTIGKSSPEIFKTLFK
jgi:fatty acid-binding protein DegV